MELVWTRLRIKLEDGSATETSTFLPVRKDVKVGTIITLKGDPMKHKWVVAEQGCKINFSDIKRSWNNNI